jgi:hypothetical protein
MPVSKGGPKPKFAFVFSMRLAGTEGPSAKAAIAPAAPLISLLGTKRAFRG